MNRGTDRRTCRGTDRDAPTLEGFLRLPSYVHPVSSGANVLARLQKRDSFFPRPLCLPFRHPLPASVPGPFFLRSSFQAHSRLKLAGNRPPHPRNPLPATLQGRNFCDSVRDRTRTQTQWADTCSFSPETRFREVRSLFELFSSSAVAALLCFHAFRTHNGLSKISGSFRFDRFD